ncbi:hypothetical protein ACHHYP_07825 [Achlya hypogyna]|uniref:Helicase-associated domain-containing protein n=1 Tax=Achlya hypogyna TaxID=1202772 RepID=A0A1V9YQG0_ACHHY|nr:hypothetical protein ACHHYP_07825 [Achlya hypogyna]
MHRNQPYLCTTSVRIGVYPRLRSPPDINDGGVVGDQDIAILMLPKVGGECALVASGDVVAATTTADRALDPLMTDDKSASPAGSLNEPAVLSTVAPNASAIREALPEPSPAETLPLSLTDCLNAMPPNASEVEDENGTESLEPVGSCEVSVVLEGSPDGAATEPIQAARDDATAVPAVGATEEPAENGGAKPPRNDYAEPCRGPFSGATARRMGEASSSTSLDFDEVANVVNNLVAQVVDQGTLDMPSSSAPVVASIVTEDGSRQPAIARPPTPTPVSVASQAVVIVKVQDVVPKAKAPSVAAPAKVQNTAVLARAPSAVAPASVTTRTSVNSQPTATVAHAPNRWTIVSRLATLTQGLGDVIPSRADKVKLPAQPTPGRHPIEPAQLTLKLCSPESAQPTSGPKATQPVEAMAVQGSATPVPPTPDQGITKPLPEPCPAKPAPIRAQASVSPRTPPIRARSLESEACDDEPSGSSDFGSSSEYNSSPGSSRHSYTSSHGLYDTSPFDDESLDSDAEPSTADNRSLPRATPVAVDHVPVKSEFPRPLKRERDSNDLDLVPTTVTKKVRTNVPWSHKVEAFSHYKIVHGQSWIPIKYVIPAAGQPGADVWPVHLQGLKVGSMAASLRAAPPTDEARLADLEAIGFPWSSTRGNRAAFTVVPASRMRSLILALRRYHQLHGHCNVPPAFKVPANDEKWPTSTRGLQLHAGIADLTEHAFALPVDELAAAHSFGLLKDIPPWNSILSLLKTHRALYGDGSVPLDFIVPRGPLSNKAVRDVPLGTLAWRLGLRQAALPASRRQQLAEVGFVFNDDRTWSNILKGLCAYHAYAGTVKVPEDFVVPGSTHDEVDDDTENEWPRFMWGMALGRWRQRLVGAEWAPGLPETTRNAWNDLVARPPVPGWRLQRIAFEAYARHHQTIADIPPDFVVPADTSWPTEVQGLALGAMAATLTSEKLELTLGQKNILRRLGSTAFGPLESTKPIAAIKIYRRICGDALVPPGYVVPAKAAQWPSYLSNYALGDAVEGLRRRAKQLPASATASLDDLGFFWDAKAQDIWVNAVKVLDSWCALHPQTPIQEESVVVLDSRPRYAGFYIVQLVVLAEFSTPARAALVASRGVDTAERWAAYLAALRAFEALYHHVHVPRSFVVPFREAHWPPATWDLPLGLIVAWLRQGEASMEEAKRAELAAMGFRLAPADLDVVEPLKGHYRTHLYGQEVIPESFVVPEGDCTSWPQHMRGLPLGVLVRDLDAWLVAMKTEHQTTFSALMESRVDTAIAAPADATAAFLAALRSYRDVHGNIDVPVLFAVPSTSTWWPSETKGMPLGYLVHVCRENISRLPLELQKALNELGFTMQSTFDLVTVKPRDLATREATFFGPTAEPEVTEGEGYTDPPAMASSAPVAALDDAFDEPSRSTSPMFTTSSPLRTQSSPPSLTPPHVPDEPTSPQLPGTAFQFSPRSAMSDDTAEVSDADAASDADVVDRFDEADASLLCSEASDAEGHALDSAGASDEEDGALDCADAADEPDSSAALAPLTSKDFLPDTNLAKASTGPKPEAIPVGLAKTSDASDGDGAALDVMGNSEASASDQTPERLASADVMEAFEDNAVAASPVLPSVPVPNEPHIQEDDPLELVPAEETLLPNEARNTAERPPEPVSVQQPIVLTPVLAATATLAQRPPIAPPSSTAPLQAPSRPRRPASVARRRQNVMMAMFGTSDSSAVEDNDTATEMEVEVAVASDPDTTDDGDDAASDVGSQSGCGGRDALSANVVLRALKVFCTIHHHTVIPRDFEVPHGDPRWPRDTWGLGLGQLWAKARNDNVVRRSGTIDNTTLQEGRRAHRALTGHLHVASSFVVPASSAWPRHLWGVPLGSAPEASPHASSFMLTSRFDFEWESFLRALGMYKAIHGHVKVARTFTIPVSDWNWPEPLWNYALGAMCAKIQEGHVLLSPTNLEKLMDLELELSPSDG